MQIIGVPTINRYKAEIKPIEPDTDNAGAGIKGGRSSLKPSIVQYGHKMTTMKNGIFRLFSISFFIAIFTSISFGQSALYGEVYDEFGETLPGATIVLTDTDRVTATDAYGFFILRDIPSGSYEIEISYVGKKFLKEKINIVGRTEVEYILKDDVVIGETITVSSTRVGENMPFTYSNLNKEDIEKNNLGQDLPFLLKYLPSTVVSSDAGAGIGYTGIRIRGSDATRTNVVINDIPLNDPESQATFLVNIPDFASSTNSIQMQRGVGASSNGAGAFGATINLDTKGYSTDPFVIVDNSFGSFNTRRHALKLNTGLLKDHWNFAGRFSLIKSDGFIDRSNSDLKSAYFTGGYYAEKTSIQAIAFTGKEITNQAWNGVPESKVTGDQNALQEHYDNNIGALYNTAEDSINLFSSDRRYNAYLYDNEIDNYKQDHYQLHLSQQVNNKLNLNVSLHYTKGKGYFEQFRYQDDFSDYGLSNITLNTISASKQLAETFVNNPPVTNPDAVAEIVGFEYSEFLMDTLAVIDISIKNTDLVRRRWLDNDFYGSVVSLNYNLDALDLTFGAAYHQYDGSHFGEIIWAKYASDSNLGDKYYEGESDKTDFNVFGRGLYALNEKVNLFADIQFRGIDYQTSGVDNDLNPYDVDETFSFVNPKLGFNYLLSSQDEIYASFAIANKEPSRSDFIDAIENAKPKHETLTDIEAGYKRNFSNYSFEANLYYMLYKDQLVPTGQVNDVGAGIRTNVADSYRAGIEIQTNYRFTSKVQLGLFGTFSQNKINTFTGAVIDYTDGFDVIETVYEDTDIAYSPSVVAGGMLSYSFMEGFEGVLYGKYVGEQYLDNTSNEGRKLEDYFVSDLLLSYRFKTKFTEGIALSLKVNNFFDLYYSANGYTYSYIFGDLITENFLFPQAGVNLLFGLKGEF